MPLDAALAWRAVTLLMLGWLAFFFGRTLRPGREPLITRIARVSDPGLAPPLCRYTRRLTAVWCGYFVLTALTMLAWGGSLPAAGLLVWIGTIVLFVGEHWLRPHLFPGERFPSLRQQLRDTLHVWRPASKNGD